MSIINVQRDNTDPFYRYKMPAIISKIEGRGNGIRTAVVNTTEVARSLNRPPVYINKFFGFELGAQTSANESQDRYIVNGAHDAQKLQDLLDVFINKFVLCKYCKNPETDIIISKVGTITRDCKACGRSSDIEPTHKLAAFILKNPPSNNKKKGKKAAATASSDVGQNALNSKSDLDGDYTNDNEYDDYNDIDDNSDDELTRRIKAEAELLPTIDNEKVHTEWTVDTSEEAVNARVKDLISNIHGISLLDGDDDDVNSNNDQEDDGNNPYSEIGDWIIKNRPSDIEIYKKAKELNILDKSSLLQVLAQSLFTKNIVSEIKPHAGFLKKLITDKSHEKAFLGGTERFIGNEHPDLIPVYSKILYEYYNLDLISEEAFIKWGAKPSKKYTDKSISKKIHKSAQPFLAWLQESDSEDEE